MRATIESIAREAGVSTATVDRTLNGREGVRERTRQRVILAAERLGYFPERQAGGRVEPVDVDFLLPGGTNTFILDLARQLDAVSAGRRAEANVRVHLIEGFNPEALAARLVALKGRTSGVGVVALDHPAVREAIREVSATGTPVVTMVSDISNVPRVGYVGIDNRAAGRLAGHLLGRFVAADRTETALFAGSLSYRGHEEREMGFRHILAEEHRRLEIVALREVRDDSQHAYEEARTLLSDYPRLAGIYNIGGGNRGIARALEEAGRVRDVVFICHELTEHTRRFLLAGTLDAVIDQSPRLEAREAVDCLVHAARGTSFAPTSIPIAVIFKENIPGL